MKFELPQIYFSKLMRAITEFELIQNDDNILIGVSGGKDSIFLAYALAMMKTRLKKRFHLKALTINPMFSKGANTALRVPTTNLISPDLIFFHMSKRCQSVNPL